MARDTPTGQVSGPDLQSGFLPSHLTTRPSLGRGQQAPLTPEYQKLLEDSIADQAPRRTGQFPHHAGPRSRLPHMMMAFGPLEVVVTPETTYILIGWYDHYRRIFTDGRDWPAEIEPTFAGYSIGRWIDTDGDGAYDTLEVETRGFKGPRAYDEAGLPLHIDNQSIFKERIYRDRDDPNILHDEITTIDNALTRPWTVDKKYVRNPSAHPDWPEYYITEGNGQIAIGKENYFLSAEGLLMPAKKNQSPPDLRYFKRASSNRSGIFRDFEDPSPPMPRERGMGAVRARGPDTNEPPLSTRYLNALWSRD